MYFYPDVRLLSFNNDEHLKNHLNYLFRTDRKQKWTNSITSKDMLLMDKKMFLFSDEVKERELMKDTILHKIDAAGADYRKTYMARIECHHPEITSFDEAVCEEVIDILHMLKAVAEDKDMAIVCAVTHEDQTDEPLHFHLLLRDK